MLVRRRKTNAKYAGPPKPIKVDPAQWSPWDKAERVVFLLGLIVVLCDVLVWRP